jgi:hypothetical protein
MRNAGDLDTASDLYEDFQTEGARLAKELNLKKTEEALNLSKKQMQKEYFERFDGTCDELRGAS